MLSLDLFRKKKQHAGQNRKEIEKLTYWVN